jgi:hypothetical protein
MDAKHCVSRAAAAEAPDDAGRGAGHVPGAALTTTVCAWEVLPSDSRFPIMVSGMSSDPGKAKQDVELALARPGAGLGQLVRVPVPGRRPGPGESGTWPPLGQIQQCRRDRHGGCSWSPLYPVPDATPGRPTLTECGVPARSQSASTACRAVIAARPGR